MELDELRTAINNALKQLIQVDGMLLNLPLEKNADYDTRKLHEVCINHMLANHLGEHIVFALRVGDPMFVDIEFNREGIDFKSVEIGGQTRRVRPDIIIHNRKSGAAKNNFLVVECKKAGVLKQVLQEDADKIVALMKSDKYRYKFGLQVIYGPERVTAFLFSEKDKTIRRERIGV